MDRIEFLKFLGTGTTLACLGCLESCAPDQPINPAPVTLDFTLDLSQAENSILNGVGGFLSKNGVIIVRISTTDFTALWQACTHQGTAVNYQIAEKNFLCPNHASKFTLTGAVINGPATSPLKQYSTSLTGTNLRVFS